MVTMVVCGVILGVGVIKHFAFESTVTREYYKEYDYAKYVHKDYYKPHEYFDERNRVGRRGCGVYGTILSIMILDILTSFASCYIGRVTINKTQVSHFHNGDLVPLLEIHQNQKLIIGLEIKISENPK
jgi:hypothetical protein